MFPREVTDSVRSPPVEGDRASGHKEQNADSALPVLEEAADSVDDCRVGHVARRGNDSWSLSPPLPSIPEQSSLRGQVRTQWEKLLRRGRVSLQGYLPGFAPECFEGPKVPTGQSTSSNEREPIHAIAKKAFVLRSD